MLEILCFFLMAEIRPRKWSRTATFSEHWDCIQTSIASCKKWARKKSFDLQKDLIKAFWWKRHWFDASGAHISSNAVRRHLLEAGKKAKKPLKISLFLKNEVKKVNMGKNINAGLKKTGQKCCFQMTDRPLARVFRLKSELILQKKAKKCSIETSYIPVLIITAFLSLNQDRRARTQISGSSSRHLKLFDFCTTHSKLFGLQLRVSAPKHCFWDKLQLRLRRIVRCVQQMHNVFETSESAECVKKLRTNFIETVVK